MAQLNVMLRDASEQDLGRRIQGRPATIADQLAHERPLLRALPEAGAFDSTEIASVRVDSKALVTVRQNRYSVPVALAGLRVAAAVGATEIRISHQGQVVARHERLHGRFGTAARLDHYLELLRRKPGGLQRSLALAQERERGAWPGCFDELWAALDRALRRLGSGPADGRRSHARARARARPRGARRSRRARGRRDRRQGGRDPRTPHHASAPGRPRR